MLPRRLNKPYYVFRPRQLPQRLRQSFVHERRSAVARVRLPWSLDLDVRGSDSVGHVLVRTGVFDICVTETLFRLLDRGEVAVDVGAHVGYMTSVMAARVGPTGNVIAVEPQPDVFEELEHNVAAWREGGLSTEIALHRVALSDQSGTSRLSRPGDGWDRGGASLARVGEATYEVPLRTLADLLAGVDRIAVVKVDVEGHQLEVLQGGRGLLEAGRIRDLIFEDVGQHPTPATSFLEAHGYTIFKLDRNLLGPWIGPGESPRQPLDDQSYLATKEPARALDRMRPRGWASLSPRTTQAAFR